MKRIARVRVLLAAIVALVVLAVVAPAAFAGTVTKIMYAEESVDYYAYQATTAGTLSVTLGWTKADGTGAPVFPVACVSGAIQTGPAADPYADLDVTSLFAADTNPNSGAVDLVAGQVAYIGVVPSVGDVPYSLSGSFSGTGNWLGKVDAAGNSASPTTESTFSAAGMAYASDGETYVKSTGQWFGVGQYWAGKESNNTARTNWNLYAIDRSNYLDGYWPEWTYPFTWESGTARAYTGNGQVGSSTLADGDIGTPDINKWYTIAPQEWGAMAVPNVWPSVPVDPYFRYGKPGSITATTAPLYYTYSYSDDSVVTKPAYFWPTASSASASKRDYSVCIATKASFSAAFSGTSITWVYTMGKGYGIANVYIDGVFKGTVDQYNNGFLFRQTTTYSGLSAGDHVITITNSTTKNMDATSSAISHDAFLAKGYADASDPTPVLENNYDGMTTYLWATAAVPGASGGSYSVEIGTKAVLAQRFDGTSITWKYTMGKGYGIANVYIDGVFEGTVDQYNNGFLFQQTTTYSGLADGPHIILITNSATKNRDSTNSAISHDAVIVGATTIEN